jgi:hypothetical protein
MVLPVYPHPYPHASRLPSRAATRRTACPREPLAHLYRRPWPPARPHSHIAYLCLPYMYCFCFIYLHCGAIPDPYSLCPSRVIRRCIDLCAPPAADPLNLGSLRASTLPISFGSPPRARSCLRSLTVFATATTVEERRGVRNGWNGLEGA